MKLMLQVLAGALCLGQLIPLELQRCTYSCQLRSERLQRMVGCHGSRWALLLSSICTQADLWEQLVLPKSWLGACTCSGKPSVPTLACCLPQQMQVQC